GNAQITITQSDMPTANDTIRYCNADPTATFTPTATGANYTWNFQNLTETSQGLYEYVNSISTPYLFYFFNKTGLKTIDTLGVGTFALTNIHTFFTSSSSVFKIEGLGYSYSSIPLANSYVDEDELYQFPLQFGDYDSSTYYFDYDLSQVISNVEYAQNGSRVNDVDGWGSLSIPNASYPNVLRVKTTIISHDTLIVFGFPVITDRTTIEYRWLSNNEKIPVLEISGTMLGNNYTVNTIKYRYHPSPASVINNYQLNNLQFGISPNPAQDLIYISLPDTKNYMLSIIDFTGKLIDQQQCNQFTNNISTAVLPRGVYFIKISNSDNTLSGVQKVVLY
ncbi:MAG: T9SS type A sorting domain-containing protein, partial [Bacteroidia bacterium]